MWQYGSLLTLSTLPQGTPFTSRSNNFQGVQSVNPCPVSSIVAAAAGAIVSSEGGGGE